MYWQDILPELIGSGVGAFLGFLLGILLERKMRLEENKEEKREYINAIINEIKFNFNVLKGDLKEELISGEVIKIIAKSYLTYSFDSVINSGKYSSLSSEIQLEMAILYSAFNKLNEMRHYHKRKRNGEYLKNTSAIIESLGTNLKKRLPVTLKLLEKEKNFTSARGDAPPAMVSAT